MQNRGRKAKILRDTNSFSPSSFSISPSTPIHTVDTHGDPVSQAEKLVTDALDELVAIGVLDPSNRTSLEEFLSPAAENIYDTTDEDIFQTVMDAKEAREANKGGSDAVFCGSVNVHKS